MMFRKIRNKIGQFINHLFLALNRWEGRNLNEISQLPLDVDAYAHTRHVKRTEYYMGMELEDRLMARIDILHNLIRHCEQTPYDDTHMLTVWIPALRATERKLNALRTSRS